MAATDVPATVVDVNDTISATATCFAVVGNAMVYRDSHHMTAAFAATLAPIVAESLPNWISAS